MPGCLPVVCTPPWTLPDAVLPEHPEGVLRIHPAVKLITGDTGLSASKAADVIKRLLQPLEDELDGELRKALDIALRLRPRSGKAAGAVR